MNARSILLVMTTVAAIVPFGSSGVVAQGIQHFAVMNGGNEVGATGQAAAGDPDGSGTAAVIVRGAGQVCFSILVERLGTPVAAHIHEAVAGANGPIRVVLVAPAAGNPGTSAGCVSGIAAGLLTRLRNTPNLFYVNVHTTAFPDGAVRGQLF